ncbi:redoxin family protein [Chitinophagaceae bacterium 26-R-25]|nr:redoxin family protein [Chitinophagaceae bacterium 26-R-25]
MQSVIRKVLAGAAMFVGISAWGQSSTHVVSGIVSEKVNADLWVNKLVGNKILRVAEYKISPSDGSFLFAIPKDSASVYRFQLNVMKPHGRHFTNDKICLVTLSLNPDKDYSLSITPSKFDTLQKKGWEVKQLATSPKFALVTGSVKNVTTSLVSLNTVAEGALKNISTVTTNNNGEFAIPVNVKSKGFYYLSSPRWKSRVYLQPSDNLQVEVDNKTGFLSSVNGSLVNQILYNWQQLTMPVTSYGYNLSTFNSDNFDLTSYINNYKKLQPSMDAFVNDIDIKDNAIKAQIREALSIDKELAPINLLFQLSAKKIGAFRPQPKDFNDVPDLYKTFIKPGKFNTTSLLKIGETRQYMKLYALLNVAALPKEKRDQLSKGEKLKLMINSISNDTLKSYLFKDQMDQIEVNNLSEFRETFEPLKRYAKLSPANETYKGIFASYASDTAFIGKSAYDFTLPDSTGKMVSMKDFKGRVVLIDVWATWCGPCKAQMPFLKEIEEEYAGNKNIVFVGISLDKMDARQKWMNMVNEKQLGGVQLIDDFGKAFGRKYQLTAIPRFMLIDKHGKWIEIRCPKPEAKEDLKRYIDKALLGNSETLPMASGW